MTHNPYLNLCISSPFSKFRFYGATESEIGLWSSRVVSSHCQPIVSVSNILCVVPTWNSVLLFHCIFLYVFLQVFYHQLYCVTNFLKCVYFSMHITEINSSVFIKVITFKLTSAKKSSKK